MFIINEDAIKAAKFAAVEQFLDDPRDPPDFLPELAGEPLDALSCC
ncbi:hypothetical protein ACSHT2_06900 [Bradyrhizobium sp. PUT101]